MLYGIWTTSKDDKGKLQCMSAQSRIALDQELGRMELASWLVEFEATNEAEYKREEAKWRKRTSINSYSGFTELPH